VRGDGTADSRSPDHLRRQRGGGRHGVVEARRGRRPRRRRRHGRRLRVSRLLLLWRWVGAHWRLRRHARVRRGDRLRRLHIGRCPVGRGRRHRAAMRRRVRRIARVVRRWHAWHSPDRKNEPHHTHTHTAHTITNLWRRGLRSTACSCARSVQLAMAPGRRRRDPSGTQALRPRPPRAIAFAGPAGRRPP
jgi:hypothetical protein